jgi:transcriptional regulator with XRE-family HTH domain
MFKDAASLVSPPALMMARSKGVSDMAGMSSTASRQSQDPLHLHRQAALYAVDMTLGTKIRKARTAKKLSLEKLGTALGVTRQLVWQWERDQSEARTYIEGLSRVLGMPVEYFHGAAQPPTSLEAKIKLLNPEHREFMDVMADKFLQQQEAEMPAPSKKA